MGYNECIMLILFALLFFILSLLLIFLTSVQLHPSTISEYELQRRAKLGDQAAKTALTRNELLGGLFYLLRIKSLIVSVLLFVVGVGGFGWLIGSLVTLVVIIFHVVLGETPFFKRLSGQLVAKYEPFLLRCTRKVHPILTVSHGDSPLAQPVYQAHSRTELAHLIDSAGGLLSTDEQHLMSKSLQFDSVTVAEVMTPKERTVFVDSKELLGPLVLDDLHKTGHSFFPVMSKGSDKVAGILRIGELVTLDSKRSLTVEKAMSPHLEYIQSDQSLRAALRILLSTHQQLLVVRSERHDEMVGIITLYDCLVALFGSSLAS